MTQSEAYARLPADAVWSCSFGLPGKPGFRENWRSADGRTLFTITNGRWCDDGREWSLETRTTETAT